jgi:hypothetical protein
VERIVLKVALVLVCLAGAWLCAAALLLPESRSETVAKASAVAAVLLVATLASLAAAQAWDRGARVRAVTALFAIETTAALALYVTFFPEAARAGLPFLFDALGAAFVALVFCGAAVVEAPARDRWIGHVAAGTFSLAYAAYLVGAHARPASDAPLRLGVAAYAAGLTATAAYSLRARQARLAARAGAVP